MNRNDTTKNIKRWAKNAHIWSLGTSARNEARVARVRVGVPYTARFDLDVIENGPTTPIRK